MIYLDTAALVKLVRREQESDALADWLDERSQTVWVSSALVDVELPRAVRRTEPDLVGDIPAVLAHIARYEIDELVRAAAAAYPDPELRSLDAIHLATARTIFGGQLTAFVSYDRRLLAAAQGYGLPIESPAPA
ncbi:MAG: type II toxin-antitoxin system VapC family toxin [Pseudonocardiaceae bacterium]